jgi:hypothetical protein
VSLVYFVDKDFSSIFICLAPTELGGGVFPRSSAVK